MTECLNCCEEFEEGTGVYDDYGNAFCSEDHKDRYHEDDKKKVLK